MVCIAQPLKIRSKWNKAFFCRRLRVTVSCILVPYWDVFIYNFADIRDYKNFLKRTSRCSAAISLWIIKEARSYIFPTSGKKEKRCLLNPRLRRNNTVAFLVIRNDSVFMNGTRQSTPKINCAFLFHGQVFYFVNDRHGHWWKQNKSTNEPITNYIDFLDKKNSEKLQSSISLDMQSGIKKQQAI